MTDHADEKQISTTDSEARKSQDCAGPWANLLEDQPTALPRVLAELAEEHGELSIIPTSPTIGFLLRDLFG